MMRGDPSTIRVSFENACRLSFVLAFSTMRSCGLHALPVERLAHAREAFLDLQVRVPDVQVPHPRELPHRLAVLAHRRSRMSARSASGEPVVAPGDRQARGEPLDVPLPRARERLVEVVDVEHELALGRAEDAEVREVGVAADLGRDPRSGCGREVGRHDHRGAAVERERRREHPAVADRARAPAPASRPAPGAARSDQVCRPAGSHAAVARARDTRASGLADRRALL